MKKNVLDFEPGLALFVENNNPLKYYRSILKFASNSLHNKGFLFFEINENYSAKFENICKLNSFYNIRVISDVNRKNRFLLINTN